MKDTIKILHLEDMYSDARLVKTAIEHGKIDAEILVVDKKEEFIEALNNYKPDVILSDHSLPAFNSVEALKLTRDTGRNIPFVLVTETISEEFAAEVMKAGASDYVLKDRLMRLPEAIKGALKKTRLQNEKNSGLLREKGLIDSLEGKVISRTSELTYALKECEAFNFTVSHDLKAPLRIMSGFAKILVEEYATLAEEKRVEYLKVIDANAQTMSSLINALLEFAQLGKQKIHKHKVDMNQLVKIVVDEFNGGANKYTGEIKIGNLLPAFGDPQLLKQVWTNLISNAFKYSSKKEKPYVEIGMKASSGNQLYYVRDNGAGFDMKHSAKLFDVFQRLHRIQEFEGIGVGLATVERIILKHGGEIWGKGKIDQGATFYFNLPGI